MVGNAAWFGGVPGTETLVKRVLRGGFNLDLLDFTIYLVC